ncbi:MAG: SRPBCC family protein [Gemmatimonadales bacterium]
MSADGARWTHEESFPIAASADRVYRALTTPDELERWFAERVEVDLRPGGALRFWGRYTLGTPTREGADQSLTLLERSRLGFRWTLLGVPTEVELEVAPVEPSAKRPGGAQLTVRHRIDGPLPGPRPRELIEDWWKLSFGNLGAHLAGGEGLVRPDFSERGAEVRLSVSIDAPREAVFKALLEPEQLDKWIASAARVEPRVGGAYGFGWRYQIDGRDVSGGPTRILELVPNERLVVDWPDWRGDSTVTGQTITWLLETEGRGTRVTLVHAGFSRPADVSDYPFGWGHFLASLSALFSESRAEGGS